MEIIGLVLPPIVDLINRFINDKSIRFLVAFFFCALFGIGLNWLQTDFTYVTRIDAFNSLSASILGVFGASQITYQLGYGDSKIQDTIRGK